MNEIAILEKIIEEDGNCCWATGSICSTCPLGQIVRNEKRQFMSCIEAIGIDGLSEDEADAKYKEAAMRKLADLTMQDIIEAD